MDILDYIAGASLYEVIEHNGKEYRLVHAGLANFTPDKDLDEYDLYDFLEERADYSKRYYPDEAVFLVTGHTPTVLINDWEKPEVYRKTGILRWTVSVCQRKSWQRFVWRRKKLYM